MLKRWFSHFKAFFQSSSLFAKQFYEHFGFHPGQPSLYQIAFAHRSAPFSTSQRLAGCHNERLEFLGDAVLSSILAEVVFNRFPKANEGLLTRIRSDLAKRSTLDQWSQALGIPYFLKYDPSLDQNPQSSTTIYGNAFEALIGAIYLDKGYVFTSRFVNDRLLKPMVNFSELAHTDTNYKSQLTEWAQQNGVELSFKLENQYEYYSQKVFVISVWLDGLKKGTAEGYRKKNAEQEAARKVLNTISLEPAS